MAAADSIVETLDCCICLGEVENRGRIACDHAFCFPCIVKWSKVENTCPICKRSFKKISEEATPKKGEEKRGVKRKAPKEVQVNSLY
jgi:hypothetical protein